MPAMFQANGLPGANNALGSLANNLNGVFSANKVKLQFAATGTPSPISGVLVQSINFTYSQNISRIYEIGDQAQNSGQANMYYVVGRTQGQAAVQRVVGPQATIAQIYSQYGDACKACVNDLVLNFNEQACCVGGQAGSTGDMALMFTLKFCVLQQVGAALNANDMIVNENTSIMFSDLLYEGGGAVAGP